MNAEQSVNPASSLLAEHSARERKLDLVAENERGVVLSSRVADAWMNMRASTRALLDEHPSEGRLIFFVLLSDVIFFLARTLSLVVAPAGAAQKFLPIEIGLWLVLVFVLRTATLYLFSGVVCFVGRRLGGTANWRETRAAVFWASLVAAPVGVLGALIGATFGRWATQFPILASDPFVIAPLILGPVAFVWFLSAGVAEAHGAKRTSPVFIAFSVVAFILAVGTVVFAARL
ncbi:MAG: YIP1 family protein [Pseudomonadota bacterium]